MRLMGERVPFTFLLKEGLVGRGEGDRGGEGRTGDFWVVRRREEGKEKTLV